MVRRNAFKKKKRSIFFFDRTHTLAVRVRHLWLRGIFASPYQEHNRFCIFYL